MKFLNGFKTILGVAILVATTAIKALGKDDGGVINAVGNALGDMADHVASVAAGAGSVLTILGVIHKREKKTEEDTTVPPSSPSRARL